MLSDVILEYWWNSYCGLKETVPFGDGDPEYIRFWFNLRRKDVAEEMESTKRILVELGKKSLNEVKEIASGYEFPEFEVVIPRNSCGIKKEPAPVDEASKRRKLDATTLNCCGWCRYRGNGGIISSRGYHIIANCALLDKGRAPMTLRFNTPCVILKNNEEFWEACKEHLRFKLVKLEAEKAMLDVYAKNIE